MGLSSEELIERLDSLWFFSNPLVPFSSRDQTTQMEEELPPKTNAMTPTVQPMGEPLTPKSMGSPEPKKGEEEETRSLRRSKRARSRRGKVRGTLQGSWQETYFNGFLDTYYYWPVSGILGESTDACRPTSTLGQGKRSILGEIKFLDLEDGYGGNRSGSHDENQVKLPLLDLEDAMAMKEQLKSWAYAVACTVR